MDNFAWSLPTQFVFGKGVEEQAGVELKRLGASKVLIHYGSGSCVRSGLLARVEASLAKEGIESVRLGGVVPNPRLELVYTGIELAKAQHCDAILAVGGGSVIDSAKAIAAGALDDGELWDFFERTRFVQKALPIGCVLTIAAAGSESSHACVITRSSDDRKRSFHAKAVIPRFALMNPELTMTLPAFQTASGAADIMAHVLERYFTPSLGGTITDHLCEAILLTVLEELPKALAHPDDYEARANLMWASTLAHNDTCGVGRVQDWGSHALEHELSGLYDCAHGAGLAVIFPAWLAVAVDKGIGVERMANLAERVFAVEKIADKTLMALEGIERLKRFFKQCGLPINFAELGAQKEDIPQLVRMLEVDKRQVGRFMVLDQETATAIYERACW